MAWYCGIDQHVRVERIHQVRASRSDLFAPTSWSERSAVRPIALDNALRRPAPIMFRVCSAFLNAGSARRQRRVSGRNTTATGYGGAGRSGSQCLGQLADLLPELAGDRLPFPPTPRFEYGVGEFGTGLKRWPFSRLLRVASPELRPLVCAPRSPDWHAVQSAPPRLPSSLSSESGCGLSSWILTLRR